MSPHTCRIMPKLGAVLTQGITMVRPNLVNGHLCIFQLGKYPVKLYLFLIFVSVMVYGLKFCRN